MKHLVRLVPALLLSLVMALAAGCGSKKYAPYSPHEDLLSIAAEFQLVASQNPYANEPGRDLTGQNIARVTLVRLENYSQLHQGRFVPEVDTLKARALELLGDYESARRLLTAAAEYDTELKDDCLRRVKLLGELQDLTSQKPAPPTFTEYLTSLQEQAAAIRQWADATGDPFYQSLGRIEEERIAVGRAELMSANRWLIPEGDAAAEKALTEVMSTYRDSWRQLEHALRLARFHRELAEVEARMKAPTRLDFDASRFDDHYQKALDLLYRVSQADGRGERLIAQHELDAVLALGQLVHSRAR